MRCIGFSIAGLKIPNGEKNKASMSFPDLGGGSFSSGSSLLTIASVANSDPDPDFRHNPDGFGNNGHDGERWYHTTVQVAVPFFIAGIGTIGAGLVLAMVKVSDHRRETTLSGWVGSLRITDIPITLKIEISSPDRKSSILHLGTFRSLIERALYSYCLKIILNTRQRVFSYLSRLCILVYFYRRRNDVTPRSRTNTVTISRIFYINTLPCAVGTNIREPRFYRLSTNVEILGT